MPELARSRTQLTDTYANNCGGGASGHLCPPPCWLIAFLKVSLGKGDVRMSCQCWALKKGTLLCWRFASRHRNWSRLIDTQSARYHTNTLVKYTNFRPLAIIRTGNVSRKASSKRNRHHRRHCSSARKRKAQKHLQRIFLFPSSAGL